MFNLKRVLITGGSRGIGLSTANKFKEQGYDVVVPKRDALDLSNPDSVHEYITKHKNEHFDVIINNAGCNDINMIENITDEEIDSMFHVNLISPIILLRSFVGEMKKHQYGRIVNIGSIWASVSKPGRCVYSATKNGIQGVTNTLALELAPYNILVNTVCPGFTLTELTRKNNTQDEINAISQNIPLQRMANPREIAEVIYFLGSECNTYITGQKIMVDGGYTCQ
jgi:3-oxoacyl-[acyl-carrier protein] reductase